MLPKDVCKAWSLSKSASCLNRDKLTLRYTSQPAWYSRWQSLDLHVMKLAAYFLRRVSSIGMNKCPLIGSVFSGLLSCLLPALWAPLEHSNWNKNLYGGQLLLIWSFLLLWLLIWSFWQKELRICTLWYSQLFSLSQESLDSCFSWRSGKSWTNLIKNLSLKMKIQMKSILD